MGSSPDRPLNAPQPLTLPLSLSQREVWLDQRAWPGSAHLNIGGGAFLVGHLDLPRFEQALRLLVNRCDALRLAPLADGSQQLLPFFEPRLEVVDITHGQTMDTAAAKNAMRAWWHARIREPFVLGGQPPWRFALLRRGDELHGLTIQFHHLVMDGWGTTQVMREWAEIYQALGQTPGPGDTFTELHQLLQQQEAADQGQIQAHAQAADPAAPSASPASKASYLDFIEESTHYQASALFERDANYWRQQLQELPKPLIEPRRRLAAEPDGGPAPISTAKSLPPAHIVTQQLEQADYAALNNAAQALGATPFTCFLAALALYFARIQERQSVLIGVPSLNRSGRRFRQTPGMFVGILAIKIQLDPHSSAAELLAHVAQQVQGALRHPRYPLSDLSHQLQLMREGRDSLLDVLLSFERQDYALEFGAAELQDSRQLFAGLARYPLAVTVCEFAGTADTEMVLESSSLAFSAAETAMLGRRIWHLAQALVQEPRDRLSQFEIVPAEERWALLEGLHKDLAQLDAPQPYIDLFEHQAALRPEACALIWEQSEGQEGTTCQLSYSALARRVESLAGQLRQLGATRNKVVALAAERSPEMVVALLAIGRAGAAFLPLDPQLPHARLASILLDSEAVALLVDSHLSAELPPLHSRCLRIPKLSEPIPAPEPAEAVHAESLWTWAKARPEDLAYVLFTSGSTGRPKGVMIEHDTLSRRLAWLSRAWAINASDRSAQGTQLGFDPALIELLLPLTQGASIALPPPGRLHPQKLAAFILKHEATFSAFVPTTLNGLLAGWRSKSKPLKLRVACSGGEVLAPELAQRFVDETGVQLYNVYGPTETAIFATAWLCQGSQEANADLNTPPGAPTLAPSSDIPIGRPIDDTRIYVLDANLAPQPFGVPGDIFIGGKAVARGYLGRPDLNAQAFLPDPFVEASEPAPRMYRSGDRGWLDTLGNLHFSGRNDRQIKLRGYRIELGDVEAACCAVPGVKQAVVQKIDHEGKALLHAWLALELPLSLPEVQAGLRARLPDYMRPSSFTLMAELPLSSNGKIDHKALPSPQLAGGKPEHREANSELERELQKQWTLALRTPSTKPLASAAEAAEGAPPLVGLHDNFFDLGGDSLAALSILDAMEQYLGRRLPLQLITDNPTIAQLAQTLTKPQARPGILRAMNYSPGAAPLYLASSGHGDVMRLQNLATALKGEVNLFMLQAPLDPAPATMAEFASLYADSILAQNNPPGWLAGFSVGGITAIETANELARRGHAVRGLILLDSIHPDAMFGGAGSWRTLGWLVQKLHVQDLSMNGRRLGAMFSDPGLISQVLALRGYRCAAFDGPVLLIKSTGLASWNRLLFKPWQRLMPKSMVTREVSGLHGSIFEPQHVDQLAHELRDFLQACEALEGHDDKADEANNVGLMDDASKPTLPSGLPA